VWAGLKALPSNEKAVRQRVTRFVKDANLPANASTLARLSYANRLTDYFTPDATIRLEGLGPEVPVINGRTELLEAALAARSNLHEADFALADLEVKFPKEKPGKTAQVYAVIVGHLNGRTNRFGQAFKMSLVKTNGQWLITQMHTVEGVR
jgi:hypothetical protein